jgi:2-oxoisovalerate dehydrogenase E2 component (dihydrolipoyl transacylase)
MTPDDADANSDTQEDAQAEVKDNASETATANDSASSSASNGKHIEDFILPDIGEGIVECEIVKWNVAEGDEIEEDQAVVEVMTDKAVVEIPAKNAGTVHRLYYAQGDIAKVHSALFALEVAGEVTTTSGTNDDSPSANNNASSVASQSSVNTQTNGSSQQSAQVAPSKFSDGEYEPPIAIEGKVLASPAVRRVAREKNIDLSSVEGSGKKGRILKSDVLNLQHSNVDTSSQNSTSSAPSSSNAEKGDSNSTSTVLKGSVRTEKVRGIHAAMAKQMSASVYTIPHFTVSDELVMDNLMALRKLLKPEFEAKNVKLSFMPFFVKAMSLALNEFPVINSQLNEDATEISYFADHNIGFAVDSKIGLLVPNIKRVQDLSLLDIAVQMQDIIEQARAGRVAGEHLKGGTISISNIGAIGGITATPVINKPEAAIVALGKTQKLPRFDDEGNVSAQNIMAVNWSGDHRIIDGATMVRFNNLWMSYLTQPEKMLMHLK